MTQFKEHPSELLIETAFMRVKQTPRKVVFFDINSKQGTLFSFQKHRNNVLKVLIVVQRGRKAPTVIKFSSPLQGEENKLKFVICPDKRELALYVKSGDQEYADYFKPKFCKNSKLWALFELQDGIYGVYYDSEKPKIDFGFQWLDDAAPNPFEMMSMGLKPTFKFDNKN